MKLKGLDQVTAWVISIAITGVCIGLVLWTGKSAYQKETDAKLKLAKSAEVMLAESAKAATAPKKTQTEQNRNKSRASDESATSSVRYGYSDQLAPWRWMDLKPEWRLCGTGKMQSPIDISGAREDSKLKPIKLHYQHDVSTLTLTNSTLEATVEAGSWLEFDSDRFDLKKVFFRTPGEHRINGLPYELEIQLHHEELSGRQLVVSLQFTRGKSHPELKRIASELPRFEGEKSSVERMLWSAFFPTKKTYWLYRGSLTYPPCTEDVTWVVLTSTVTASLKEIELFSKLQKDNARPTQTLGNRNIKRSNR